MNGNEAQYSCLPPSWIKEWYNWKHKVFLCKSGSALTLLTGKYQPSDIAHALLLSSSHDPASVCHEQDPRRPQFTPPMRITPISTAPHNLKCWFYSFPGPEPVPHGPPTWAMLQLLLVALKDCSLDSVLTLATATNCPGISIPHSPG